MARTLKKISDVAAERALPIQTKVVYPEVSQSFWVHIIGYGYPPPRSLFQWCASKLKMSPIADFLKTYVEREEIVLVSSDRAEQEEWKKHADIPNTYVFAPLRGMDRDDLTYLLEKNPLSVWEETNEAVRRFYEHVEAAFEGKEEQERRGHRGVCGNTLFDYKFACWSCPYKREHESLRAYAKQAKEGYWLSPLLRYRGLMIWLSQQNENRVGRENRQRAYYPRRKQDQNEMKDYAEAESETLTMNARQTLLSELKSIMAHLQAEFFIHAPLIRPEEEQKIKEIWEETKANKPEPMGQLSFSLDWD